MLWHGRLSGSGLWLPEDKKANMWHGWKKVVAYGRVPSPAPWSLYSVHNYT